MAPATTTNRVPEGRRENSPAIHCWVSGFETMASPVGTAEGFNRPYGTLFNLIADTQR